MFYFTAHPSDLLRGRLLQGADVMVVASAFWDGQRLKVRRPPADHIGPLTIDSGGFTAARKWGTYPWTPEQYVEWIRAESRDCRLVFCACMDYACERGVDRSVHTTNLDRIRATIEHEIVLRKLAPDVPWLGVLQGNTMDERAVDIRTRRRLGLLRPFMGIGSICGRPAPEAAEVLRFYARHLPRTRFHAFGLDVRTLDIGDDVALCLESWDSYGWNWPAGQKGKDRTLLRRAESYSQYTRRVAETYHRKTILPRLKRPRQLPLIA